MATIITSGQYTAWTGQGATGADLLALANHCAAVSDAILKHLRPYSPVPLTVTDAILDAPTGNVLLLPATPVRGDPTIYYRPGAGGDVTAFTSDNLLTAGADYYMPVNAFDGWSRTGIVYRRGRSNWGQEWVYANSRSLAATINPNRGAIKVTYAAGETSVPDAVRQAAQLMVSLTFNRRKTGMPLSSESWNSYSYGASGPFSATAALASPDVAALLREFRVEPIHTPGD